MSEEGAQEGDDQKQQIMKWIFALNHPDVIELKMAFKMPCQ